MRRRRFRRKPRESSRIVLASGKAGPARGLVAKVAEELAVQIIGGGLRDHIHHARGSQPGRKREQRLLDPDLLDGAHRDIRRGSAHSFVRDVDTIHLHPGGAAIAANDGCRRQSGLGGRQHLAVEYLHSGFEPGQIQKPAVGGNLFHLRAIDRAAHFRDSRCPPVLATGATTRYNLTSPVAVAAAWILIRMSAG